MKLAYKLIFNKPMSFNCNVCTCTLVFLGILQIECDVLARSDILNKYMLLINTIQINITNIVLISVNIKPHLKLQTTDFAIAGLEC